MAVSRAARLPAWVSPVPPMGISLQVYCISPFYMSHTTVNILFFTGQLGRKKISCDYNFNLHYFPGCLLFRKVHWKASQSIYLSFLFFSISNISCQDQTKSSKKQVFPHYLKIEHSYETFCKLKWRKVKKQLPLIYMKKKFEHSQTPKITKYTSSHPA